jgi:hypothetical protein
LMLRTTAAALTTRCPAANGIGAAAASHRRARRRRPTRALRLGMGAPPREPCCSAQSSLKSRRREELRLASAPQAAAGCVAQELVPYCCNSAAPHLDKYRQKNTLLFSQRGSGAGGLRSDSVHLRFNCSEIEPLWGSKIRSKSGTLPRLPRVVFGVSETPPPPAKAKLRPDRSASRSNAVRQRRGNQITADAAACPAALS